MNCDHSLLTYSFYKQPKFILRLFQIRLREIMKINAVPALVIGIGLALILYATGGTDNPLNYVVLIVSILCMSLFFSIHYLRTSEGKRGCYFNVNTPKTEAGNRQVPMLDFVKEAFKMEKERQEILDLHCEATVDGYTDFIFINRFGLPQHQATLNKAIRRIIRDCNDEQFLKDENPDVLLPHFSCHSLRHTFTTRMCEAGVNVKVIQDTLGHKDISTTLNIYTDVTKELKRTEFEGLDLYFKTV